MISRKEFLQKASVFAAGSLLPIGLAATPSINRSAQDITILYTNDTHARLDPFPENANRFAGLGGIAERAALVEKIRAQHQHVLLLDAGDVFQGTPWFDVYGGKVDLRLMTKMKYDAMAVGNHEFDRGPDGFAEAASKAGFPILAANYIVRNTPLNPFVSRMIIKEFNGFRIGIFGLGIQFDGVVDRLLTGDVRSADPVSNAIQMVDFLRNSRSCDYIICLSHLGYSYNNGRIDDLGIAERVDGINLIIGGHTHTFLDAPTVIQKGEDCDTWITQMGHSGVRLGRIDLNLSKSVKAFSTEPSYYVIGERNL